MNPSGHPRLAGLFAPLPTPFTEGGGLHLEALSGNLSRWNAEPLDGYVVGGSNGEFPLQTREERLQVVRAVAAERAPGRLVLGAASMESTSATAEMAQAVAEAGAQAAIVVTPWYYKGRMTTSALVRHYTAVADASPIPLILYNMPANTGVDLAAEAVVELSRHANIAGLKESSPDMVKIGRLVQACRADFSVLAGSAGFFLAALAMGASGGVVALGNLAAQQLHALAEAFQAGNTDEARRLQASLLELNLLVTSRHGVAGLKAALDMLGMYGGPVRGPLEPVDAAAREEIRRAMEQAGLMVRASG